MKRPRGGSNRRRRPSEGPSRSRPRVAHYLQVSLGDLNAAYDGSRPFRDAFVASVVDATRHVRRDDEDNYDSINGEVIDYPESDVSDVHDKLVYNDL